MADKQGGEVTKADSESALLREEIVSLISSRLESIGINPTKQEISKVLNRRKKKWRKRHKSEPQRPGVEDTLVYFILKCISTGYF